MRTSIAAILVWAAGLAGCGVQGGAIPKPAGTVIPSPAGPGVAGGGREVYLAARTDGQAGTGTACDPFDASTQPKFDSLFASFGPGTVIHVGPGTYHTKGVASFPVKPYWKIHGAGLEVTKIVQDFTGQVACVVFMAHADGVEIEDLSIDCGFESQRVVRGKIEADAAAIQVFGSHIAVRRCLFKNYGSPYDRETGENFAVFVGSPFPDSGEDLIVEDCVFAGMSPLLSSAGTILTLAGGPPSNDLKANNWARGMVARRNHFMGYHFGCHGITVDGGQGAMIIDNVFEHFLGPCILQDTWPMRDLIISGNILSDVEQGIHLTCNNLNNFQIRNNIILLHDGYDLKDITGGVTHTVIEHSLTVGCWVRIRGAKRADGTTMPDKDVYVTSVPTRSSFTYSLGAGKKNEAADNTVGGFTQALNLLGVTTPGPEGITVSDGGRNSPPTNFVIDRNIIKPYSSDDSCRVSGCGIWVDGMKHCWITDNIVFDSGSHCDLVVSSPKGFTSSVICRDNYHPDGTRLLPRDLQGKLIPGGLADRDTGVEFAGLRLTHAVDPAGPAGDRHFAGKPGDYAVRADCIYVYTGDGKTHQWKVVKLADY